jgi:hypothetical protein
MKTIQSLKMYACKKKKKKKKWQGSNHIHVHKSLKSYITRKYFSLGIPYFNLAILATVFMCCRKLKILILQTI